MQEKNSELLVAESKPVAGTVVSLGTRKKNCSTAAALIEPGKRSCDAARARAGPHRHRHRGDHGTQDGRVKP